MIKWILVPIIAAIFTILVGTLIPVLHEKFYKSKGTVAVWILFMSIGGVVFAT
jgi:hypothetical protein